MDDLNVDLTLMENVYASIQEIFEMSVSMNMVKMIRKLNYSSNFNDVSPSHRQRVIFKEEPQFLAFILYFYCRLYRYATYYHIPCLVQNSRMYEQSIQNYKKMDSALILLSLESNICQSQIKIFVEKRVLIRIERVNMICGKFKKKQKKRLLILTNDRIIWCSILPTTTKQGQKFKYKGSYKIRDRQFQMKPFYFDNFQDDFDEESMVSFGTIHHQQSLSNHDNIGIDNAKGEQFGFKFGLDDGNGDKFMKTVICSECQQQLWHKAVNATLFKKDLNASSINLQSIDLFERFLKDATSWNRDKIWQKVFESNSESLLPIIVSLFYDLLSIPSDEKKESICSSPTESEECGLDESFDKHIEESIESKQSHRSSLIELNERNETNKLRKELAECKAKLEKLQNEYRILQNENTILSARNVYLSNRLISSNKLFSINPCFKSSEEENILYVNEDEDDDDSERTLDVHMKMISHQRKNSESEISFISAFDAGNDFVCPPQQDEDTRRQLSKSRDEFMIKERVHHKKKPKRKSKRSKHRKSKQMTKAIYRAKTSVSSSESEID